MGELTQAIKLFSGIKKTYLLKCPNGRYTYCGNVPVCLTKLTKNSIGQQYHQPFVFDTKEEALKKAEEYSIIVEG